MHIYTYIYIYVYIYTYIHIYVYMYTYICLCGKHTSRNYVREERCKRTGTTCAKETCKSDLFS